MPITEHPLHGSQRAQLTHWALASGHNAKSPQRIGVTDTGRRNPMVDQSLHPLPGHLGFLAASSKRPPPVPDHSITEKRQRRAVHWHAVVLAVPSNHRRQPLAHFRDRVVQALPKIVLHVLQFGLQPRAHGLTQNRKHAIASLLCANMREAEKVECLRFAQPGLSSVLGRIGSKLQKPRFVAMQLQSKLRQSLAEIFEELLGDSTMLKAQHGIISEAHDDHLAIGPLCSPFLDPQVEHVVQVHIGQQRTDTAALNGTLLTVYSLPLFQHASVQPFLDEPYHAPVPDPVLDELHQPLPINGVEKSGNVDIQHPVHLRRQQSRVERIQRMMLATPRTEPVRKPKEIDFVDGIQHLNRGPLDHFVLQDGHAQGPFTTIGLGDERSSRRLRPVRSALQPRGKIVEILLQILAVMPPRHTIDPRRGIPLEAEVGLPKRVGAVDVVQERSELQRRIPRCGLTYSRKRLVHASPALSPEHVVLVRVPFGQPPSLPPLRRWTASVVRGLLRYYAVVRLPTTVRHRRTSLDFPMRPAAPCHAGGGGISRFPNTVRPNMRRVSDRAGSQCASRYRHIRCGLPQSPTRSAPQRQLLSRLNTQPARSPVNASRPWLPHRTRA